MPIDITAAMAAPIRACRRSRPGETCEDTRVGDVVTDSVMHKSIPAIIRPRDDLVRAGQLPSPTDTLCSCLASTDRKTPTSRP